VKTLFDPQHALADGLLAIRSEFQVPEAFPANVLAAAAEAVLRKPTDHVDRTQLPFVTLDPARSTDLDQAFVIERNGNDLLLRYAIADVAWFVDDGGLIDTEAWTRGTTIYVPDGKSSLYPAILSEKAASLLPDGQRPAVIFTVRVDVDGNASLDGAERAIIQSRRKLAYDAVADDDLPSDFAAFADRIHAAEARRRAERVDPPEQELARRPNGDLDLSFRPRLLSEDRNATLSLAANLAIADTMFAHKTGLFRVMAAPDARAVARLRHNAHALGIGWPGSATLPQVEATLDRENPRHAALMLAIRRAGSGASYVPFHEGVVPWHSAMAACYAHATAPLRRLADRYVVEAVLGIVRGGVAAGVETAFLRLPKVMARAEATANRIDRAVIDLAEAVMLSDKIGQTFAAVVVETTERGAKIQLKDLPVIANLASVDMTPGDAVRVRLIKSDPEARITLFESAT
jgi:VacB/RNase II family 3'-5' exoribonuclease